MNKLYCNVLIFEFVKMFPAGKLGHGDTNRVYKPKVVEALQGMFIRKVCAGSQSSLALTSTGQVRHHSCINRDRIKTVFLKKARVLALLFQGRNVMHLFIQLLDIDNVSY